MLIGSQKAGLVSLDNADVSKTTNDDGKVAAIAAPPAPSASAPEV